MDPSPNFHIAIIGSGPIGKLLACSALPHPGITISQHEADVPPLRPSFGYGVGPQTLHTIHVLNPSLGNKLQQKCFTSQTWMHWWHGGPPDCHISDVQVPDGKLFGRVGREELLELLDESAPGTSGASRDIQYGKKLVSVRKIGEHEVELTFHDGTKGYANAVWAADGVNSLCRKKLEVGQVVALVGEYFAQRTCMFIGVKGWHVLIFPIEDGKSINIAAFCVEPELQKLGRDSKVSLEEILGHFPGRNAKVDTLLRLVQSDTPGGCQRLHISHMEQLGSLFNEELSMTLFGDAANTTTPHIAASMSCGVIGCCTFLHEEWNPLIRSGKLAADASHAQIAAAMAEASRRYEKKHLPLAQKLVDISAEQGPLWSGGVTDVATLKARPLFLWCCADDKR
ncbi:hypothetical protein QQS21_008583 [Conoideocrella luteorostrata]|uniref:FAD-binding domain-containing protein n=1 Tax=Conoideocrella luteorostrata TaxID=1105319 RepID=A0AAJ0CKZ9_9HYPO|nr:hypothetical protein QQS21_008583 [Conoideocrella luteorostrata]